jgi:hypothetical protein
MVLRYAIYLLHCTEPFVLFVGGLSDGRFTDTDSVFRGSLGPFKDLVCYKKTVRRVMLRNMEKTYPH